MIKKLSTLERIIEVSKQEFLEKGYKNASLRNIAASAGLTTGAIYGYFQDKNAIFEGIVGTVCEQVEQMFTEFSRQYYTDSEVASEISAETSMADLRKVYQFIYENFDVFRLLFTCAEGSSHADFPHKLVELEVTHTIRYLEQYKQVYGVDFAIDEDAIHILADSYVSALLEPIRHNMPYCDAIRHAEFLGIFFTGGWNTVVSFLAQGEK